MSNPFVAEIRLFAGNFAPTGWAGCDGQLLPISQYTAVFSLVGTYYGGDGKSNFALPNLEGSAALGQGQGAGLSDYVLGETTGTQTITLTQAEMPIHNHFAQAYTGDPADTRNPTSTETLGTPSPGNFYNPLASGLQNMSFQALTVAGGSLPHNNLQPFLTVFFIFAMQGVYPPRP